MNDHVIVSIRLVDGSYEADVELPSKMPMKKLIPELRAFLTKLAPSVFHDNQDIELYNNGVLLAENETLISRGIWDGGIIDIKEMI